MGPITMRSYGLIVLENHYLKLSVLPQLGGQALRSHLQADQATTSFTATLS